MPNCCLSNNAVNRDRTANDHFYAGTAAARVPAGTWACGGPGRDFRSGGG